MYGTIIQSATPAGAVRQVAIIPVTGESPKVYQRIAGGRGVGAAWSTSTLSPESLDELTIGAPVAVAVTDNDWRDIGQGFPGTLLQKLVRACKTDSLTADGEPLKVSLGDVIPLAVKDSGAGLSKYLPARGDYRVVTATPAVEVVKTVQPVQQAPAVSVSNEPVYTALTVPTGDPSYIERILAGEVTEEQAYEYARANQEAIAIWGHAGTGKTSSARNIASKWGVPFVQFECNPQVDEESVQGSYFPTGNPDAPLAWRYSELASAVGQPSVILLNEANRMPAKNASLFLGLLQERRLQVTRHKNEVIEVHPDCLIIMDANPGYRGTTQPDQALLDRFNIPLVFEYDRTIEEHFIPSPTLLDLATQMRVENDTDDKWGVPISTRLLINFVKQSQGLNLTFAVESFVNSFPTDEERQALRYLFEANRDNIAEELGVKA